MQESRRSNFPYVWILTSKFLKKWKGLNWYCGEVTILMVNIAPIKPWSVSQKNKRFWIGPNSREQVDEDEDARHEKEPNEALDAIDAIREYDLESDDNRHM